MTIESTTTGATYQLFAGIQGDNSTDEIPMFVTINEDESGTLLYPIDPYVHSSELDLLLPLRWFKNIYIDLYLVFLPTL